MTCWHIVLEILYKYRLLLCSTIIYRKLTMPTSRWDVETTDSLIFTAQRKSRNILQTWKYSTHCNCSLKDGQHNVTIIISLEKFDIILLFLRYLDYHLIGMNMSTHVVKYFLCRHWHGFFMSTTCWHSCMSMTALKLAYIGPLLVTLLNVWQWTYSLYWPVCLDKRYSCQMILFCAFDAYLNWHGFSPNNIFQKNLKFGVTV